MKIKTNLQKVNEALSKIREKGDALVYGSSGSFKVMGVKGNFKWDKETETLTIIITDKPWLASQSMIENEINKFFK